MRKDEEKEPATLEMLNKHLEEVRKFQPDPNANAKPPGDAARAAIDFATASAVGSLLGYGVDVWQHTSPWGLLVGLLVGTAAGTRMMFQEEARRAKSKEQQAPKNDND